jgi:hypothetical protein
LPLCTKLEGEPQTFINLGADYLFGLPLEADPAVQIRRVSVQALETSAAWLSNSLCINSTVSQLRMCARRLLPRWIRS